MNKENNNIVDNEKTRRAIKIKQRKCVACGKVKNKSELLRFVFLTNPNSTTTKTIMYDAKQKINARSFYICNDTNCKNKVVKLSAKNKSIVKHLNKNLGDEERQIIISANIK